MRAAETAGAGGDTVQGWHPTRPTGSPTVVLSDADDYLGPDPSRREIGRLVGDNLRELFVSCDPAPAMLQQFELLHPDFIAIHDVGTASSRRLVAGIAAKTNRPLQKLVIRRQGYGTPLATLEYVEFGDPDGGLLYLYSTDADADGAARHGLARVLLAHSRLAVMLVGDLPAHALAQAVQPLQADIAGGIWTNGQMLLLPLASSASIAGLGSQLGRIGRRDGSVGSGVTVRTTPQVTRPAEAWQFLVGTWNQLRSQLAGQGTLLPGLGAGAGQPTAAAAASPTVPVVSRPAAAASPHPSADRLHDYALRLVQINGVLAGCVFETATGRPVAHAGAERPAQQELAREGATLLAALAGSAARLGLEGPAGAVAAPPEAVVSYGTHHAVLRPLPQRPGLVLHALLDRASTNVTLARLQIARLDAVFDDPAPKRPPPTLESRDAPSH